MKITIQCHMKDILRQTADTAIMEAALGLMKLKRIFRDKTYREQGYKYKTDLQIKVLNDVLKITPYPNAVTRDSLGILLNLNPRSVQIWFQNARQGNDKQMTRDELKNSKEMCNISTKTLISIFKRHCSK